ncbi:hypothetical protein Nepgr_021376 [Nepenthes gracilis]|uniref:Pentatricopeptide repeat-containing protein n=1 Tax=Nepenthes gracilis TaxID=150966 RepID=A0AAD3SXE7_NEPGR|nr:hypothetical protein Nepgr_021376 [Nepenthes gracilis]
MGYKVMMNWSKQITTSQVEQLIRAEKDLHKAVMIFDSATAEYSNGFRHDHKTFGLMISRLVSSNQFMKAEEILDRMEEEKCKTTEEIFLNICRAYGRVHKPLDVIRIFQKMNDFHCELSDRSYITVLSILVAENRLKMALKFYRYMRKMGVRPSVVSLNVLIKALCMNSGTIDAAFRMFREMPNRGCPPDSYSYGTLISGLCKFGRIDDANELFREMEARDCLPSVVTYSSLINGLCKFEKLPEAMDMFKEMGRKGIRPNVFTYSSLMDGFCKCGHSSQAVELFNMMVSERLSPNMITYTILINGLCKEGKIKEALELFDRMKLQGLKPDAGLYWKIIGGFCDERKFQEAANFLDEMVLGAVSPNRLNWSVLVKIHNTVVRGLCTEIDTKRAFCLYLSMKTRGITIEPITYSSLVKCFCKKGDSLKAGDIVDEMVLDGCVPDKEIWKGIFDEFWDQRKGREADELIQLLLMGNFVEAEFTT